MKTSEAERLNRMVRDVFWLRFGREADPEDRRDRMRMHEIERWQATGAVLPRERPEEAQRRNAIIRAVHEVIGEIGPETA